MFIEALFMLNPALMEAIQLSFSEQTDLKKNVRPYPGKRLKKRKKEKK